MKLLVLINNLHLGGAERLVYDQVLLGRSRWQVRVLCLDALGPLGEALRAHGVSVTVLGMRSRLDACAISHLRRLLGDWRPDVLHLHLPRAGVLGRLASLGLCHRVVYTEHNTWETYGFLSRYLNALTYRLNHRIVAVSEAVARSALQRAGSWVRQGTMVVIPNGVDAAALWRAALPRDEARRDLGVMPEDFVVGNVGNLFPRKGHDFLLEAAELTLAEEPMARFVLVGSGDRLAALTAQAKRLGLGDRLIFAGPRWEAFRFMPAFDIFALPSLREGLPLALLEAMALGLPAVATAVGGVPEVIVEGETGLLVRPRDPRALAEAFLRLRRSPALCQATGAAAQRRIQERFSLQHVIDAYDLLYRESA